MDACITGSLPMKTLFKSLDHANTLDHAISLDHVMSRRAFLAAASAGAACAAAPAWAQTGQSPPPRLDVPYVPTPQKIVDRMLTLAKVGSDDFVMDLGCGDGRMLVTATGKFGAKGGYGVDINPVRIEEAKENARKAGVSEKVKFEIRDLFTMSVAPASVLTMYLLPDVNLKLRPKILEEMKPGSRVVSHDFNMDDWRPDYFETLDDHDMYFWVVPAKVEGAWNVKIAGEDYTLSIRQKFQYFDASLTNAKSEALIRMGRIIGDRVSFIAEGGAGRSHIFSGRVEGDTMKFDSSSLPVAVSDWSAARKK